MSATGRGTGAATGRGTGAATGRGSGGAGGGSKAAAPGRGPGGASGRRRGANDPERRERIVRAALDSIAEGGVRGTTHRAVAERAGVPLGSMTYYFDGLEEIFEEAFRQLVRTMTSQFRAAMEGARSQEEACTALAALISDDEYSTPRDTTAMLELYAYGNHDPAVGALRNEWTQMSSDALALHFAEPTRKALDALVEGFTVHAFFRSNRPDPEVVRATIDAVVARLEPPPHE
ncbi:TetR/AcrR family transcriptional regulator [Georgenia sp. Z1491]|uniref:TetR/AcrR family transcriptional regulator n=1 Tax=Georgenia sp. Z1491 TaxID=3416707 RepID=UPI003CEB55FC